MGVDVSGRDPQSKEGEYFRANVWSWRPIHALFCMANNLAGSPVADDVLTSMCHNDGAGPKSGKICNKIADVLEQMLKQLPDLRDADFVINEAEGIISFRVDKKFAVRGDGRFVNETEIKAENIPLDSLHSPYQVRLDHLREFVSFLRNCGGFEVW